MYAKMIEARGTSSLVGQAYARLKAEIVRGDLAPGTWIREREVAERFGISRTPIREALRQLASEGLIVFSPRRGATVSHPSLEEIAEIYRLLGLLEGFAARRAVRRIDDQGLQEMARLTKRLEDAVARGDIVGFYEINRQIHETFLAASDSPRLVAICATLREQLRRFPAEMGSVPGWMAESIKEHREILSAFQNRQTSGIERLIRRHWRFKVPRARILRTLAAAERSRAAVMTPEPHTAGRESS